MIPTVQQQLFAARNTIAKVVLPAIDPGDSFASEQAGLVLAVLDWVLDVQASEYEYELTELGEYRSALGQLLELSDGDTVARAAPIDETDLAATDLEGIRAQVRTLKEAVTSTYQAIAESGGTAATDASAVLAALSARQTERELSWCRMTGFPQGEQRNITSVLAEQRAPETVSA